MNIRDRIKAAAAQDEPMPITVEEVEENIGWERRVFTALFSFLFVALFVVVCISLNYIDKKFGSTADGQVMPTGIKLLQLALYGLGLHSGSVSIANFVNWTSSSFRTYVYENPYMKKHKFDLNTDLNNPQDEAARARLAWHERRFYTFYFISVGIMSGVYALKLYLQVN